MFSLHCSEGFSNESKSFISTLEGVVAFVGVHDTVVIKTKYDEIR
jgi:mannose-1-phosphate guanylyltransferase